HRLPGPEIKLHDAVIKKARHVDVTVRAEIESGGPIEKAVRNRPEQSASLTVKLEHGVVIMAGNVHETTSPAHRFATTGLSREMINKRAGLSVISKNSACIAADHIQIAVGSEAQVHRTLQATAAFGHED